MISQDADCTVWGIGACGGYGFLQKLSITSATRIGVAAGACGGYGFLQKAIKHERKANNGGN
jgi:hypothetical protein